MGDCTLATPCSIASVFGLTRVDVSNALEAVTAVRYGHDMCMDPIQTIEEVFDQAVFPEDRKC